MKPILFCSLLIFLSSCSIGKYEGFTAKEWFFKERSCDYELSKYKTALDEANQNIDEAKIYEGGSYEEMEFALGNLYPIQTP